MALLDGLRKRLIPWVMKGFSWDTTHLRSDIREARALYRDAVGNGMRSDVIMSPVMWAARRMAESPIAVKKEEDEALDFTHDVARLMKRPNPYYSGSAMTKALTIEYLIDGNAYELKIRNKMRKPVERWFVPHWCMEPHVPVGQGYIDYYEYSPGGLMGRANYGMVPVPVEDVVHHRNGLDPENIRKGLSNLKILLREIFTDDEAAMFTAMLLKNAGVMGVVIAPKEAGTMVAPGEDPETVKQKIQERWAGVRKGEAMVSAVPIDVFYQGVDAAKLDLAKLREIPEERVTSLLGIPAAVVGFGTGLQQTKVGATMSEMRAMGYEDCIIPMQNDWGDDWDQQLLPDFEESPELFRTVYDNSNVRVLRDDEGKKSERLIRQLTSGGIMLSQFETMMGYDSKPEHDVRYLPISLQVIPEAELGLPTPPPPPAPSNQPPAEPVPPKGIMTKTVAPRPVARLMHALQRSFEKQSRAWTSSLSRQFTAFGDRAGDVFARIAQAHGKAEPDWTLLGDLTLGELGMLELEYAPQYLAIARDTYGLINTILRLGVDLSDPAEMSILRAGGKRIGLVDIHQQTREAIFAAIEKGREAGEGAAAIADSIRDMVASGPWGSADTRAMMIARTETKYAQNYSSLEAYKDSDTVTGILVFDAQLGPTDEECEQLNGQTVSVDEAFALAETEHPNGTRSFAPVVGG